MLNKIKNKIDLTLGSFLAKADSAYGLKDMSPVISSHIKEYLGRQGKRVRSTLFVLSYLGYCKKPKAGIYKSSLALELLHNFMLIHDDIIDRSALRRGKPAMHAMLDGYLKRYSNIKMTGSDLGIVIADVVYAMAIDTFLAIKENPVNKEAALKKFVEAAILTGSGEFIEMLAGAKPIEKISLSEIYKIYDLKTAHYTFCSPLAVGAILAGAPAGQIRRLIDYGRCLGRAFQIKDDILDMFATEAQTGKSSLTDIKESKKTLLIWYAYKKTSGNNRRIMQKIFDKTVISKQDLAVVSDIVRSSGSLDYARKQIHALIAQAKTVGKGLAMKRNFLEALGQYPRKILDI